MIYAKSVYGEWAAELHWDAEKGISFFYGNDDFITALNNVVLRPDTMTEVFPNDIALKRAVSAERYGIIWDWLKPYPGYVPIDYRLY